MTGETAMMTPGFASPFNITNVWTYYIGELQKQVTSLTQTVHDWKTQYDKVVADYENRIAEMKRDNEAKFNAMVDHYEKQAAPKKQSSKHTEVRACKKVNKFLSRVSPFKSAYKVAHMQAMADHGVESIFPMAYYSSKKNVSKFMLVCNYEAMAELVELYRSLPGLNAVDNFHEKDDVMNSVGITEEQLVMVKAYHDKYIKGWVRDNCGHGTDSRERKKIQDGWRGYLKKNQACGCYSNLIPSLSSSKKVHDNKQKKMDQEFRKFAYWLCKHKNTLLVIDEIAKFVHQAEKQRAQRLQKKRHYEDLTSDESGDSDSSDDSCSELEAAPLKRHKYI